MPPPSYTASCTRRPCASTAYALPITSTASYVLSPPVATGRSLPCYWILMGMIRGVIPTAYHRPFVECGTFLEATKHTVLVSVFPSLPPSSLPLPRPVPATSGAQVWQYSDWVNDGDYDWPPHCAVCSESLEDSDKPTIRLSCLPDPPACAPRLPVRLACLCASPASLSGMTFTVCHNPRFPLQPATSLFPRSHTNPAQTSVADVILSMPVTSDPAAATALSDKPTPPAFASGPLAAVGRAADSASARAEGEARGEAGGAVEERNSREGEGSGGGSLGVAAAAVAAAAAAAAAAASAGAKRQPQQQGGVNIARSRTGGSDRTAVDITEEIETAYRTDEEAGERKYARRVDSKMHQRGRTHPCPSPTPPTSSGPPHLQFLRVLGSWWSPALHALPVTLTATHSHRRDKEEHAAVGAHEDGRRRAGQRRSGGVDPRKLLLIVAIV
ncbi:unnamed protein product [Closterium sp. NIES-54]